MLDGGLMPVLPEESVSLVSSPKQVTAPQQPWKERQRAHKKTVFQKAVQYLKGWCGIAPEDCSVQELNDMIEHFHRTILYLQETKIEKLRKKDTSPAA